MAEKRRSPKQPPEGELPQRVIPTRPLAPVTPDDLYDMQLGPGDPFVKKAYDRVAKTNNLGSASLRQAEDATDTLMIQKTSRRARAMTFNVQGIIWKAGFAKEIAQTPLGMQGYIKMLPDKEIKDPSGIILRPVDTSLEVIFRELVPAALLEASQRMYGLTRNLRHLCLYFQPRDEGAAAGIIAYYADTPTSRSHYLYLQTNIRQARPEVLEQILATFKQALPKAEEAAKTVSGGDFWHEIEKSVYQVKATYRTSSLAKGSTQVKQSLTSGLKTAGDQVEKAFSIFGYLERALIWLFSLPLKALIAIIKGVSNALVWLITLPDRLTKR